MVDVRQGLARRTVDDAAHFAGVRQVVCVVGFEGDHAEVGTHGGLG